MTISKATILGAGTMGSQIAALLVNAGLKVKLLDIVIDEKDPNKISKKAYDVITDAKRPLLFDLEFAPPIHVLCRSTIRCIFSNIIRCPSRIRT